MLARFAGASRPEGHFRDSGHVARVPFGTFNVPKVPFGTPLSRYGVRPLRGLWVLRALADWLGAQFSAFRVPILSVIVFPMG